MTDEKSPQNVDSRGNVHPDDEEQKRIDEEAAALLRAGADRIRAERENREKEEKK